MTDLHVDIPRAAEADPVAGVVPEWTLGDRLAKARTLAGLTQAQLAARIGIDRRTVARNELDQTKPNRAVVKYWAEVCGVDFDWLAGSSLPVTRR